MQLMFVHSGKKGQKGHYFDNMIEPIHWVDIFCLEQQPHRQTKPPPPPPTGPTDN